DWATPAPAPHRPGDPAAGHRPQLRRALPTNPGHPMNARTATPSPQSRERGSATVELLVVAIALLAFTGGLMGVGRLTSTRAALDGVAREAARAAANTTT